MNKTKKILLTVGIALDVAITIALLVIAIMMMIKSSTLSNAEMVAIKNAEGKGYGFIGYLIAHTTFYFCLFVLPLFLLLAADIVGLVIYVRKETKAEPVKVADLSDAQKEALRREILADLQKDTTPEEKVESKTENNKE